MVLSDVRPGDFSDVGIPEPFILAVSVEMDGRVCDDDDAGGLCGPVTVGPQGRWVTEVSMTQAERNHWRISSIPIPPQM